MQPMEGALIKVKEVKYMDVNGLVLVTLSLIFPFSL